MLLQVTVAENWKRDFAQLYKTQASRGGLTPPPTCHTSARWLSPNGGCGRSATKVGSHDYSSQLFEPETSWRSGVCRFDALTMAFAIGYESIAFIALENCGVAP